MSKNTNKVAIKKFDPSTFRTFDKVLIKYNDTCNWEADFMSQYHAKWKLVNTITTTCLQKVIPYNDETKNLLGTDKDCSGYYKWWEE